MKLRSSDVLFVKYLPILSVDVTNIIKYQNQMRLLHRISSIRNLPVTGQTIAGLLVKPVPNVGIFAFPQSAPGDVTGLVEVVPGHSTIRSL